MYGTCLTLWEPVEINNETVYLPKCLVILSSYPYLAAFREYLTQLVRMKNEMKLPIERYIINLCQELPAPPPGSFEVQTTMLDSVIRIWSPPHNLPIAWVSLPFGTLFECLDIDNIILVWHCLLLERQVLLTSTQYSVLTTASEIFLSLLFPMRWSHAYIPVLPTFLIPILSAPMPFLCGINKTNLAEALFDLSRECVLVDLDKNTVTLGPDTSPLPKLPPFQEAVLRAQLDDNAGMVFREARCLTKNDDFSDSGENLQPHVKAMAEAMWEGKLCLFDEAFHLFFTPEEYRKNLLNGNDASGLEVLDVDPTGILPNTSSQSGRKQSSWDAVQEAFLQTSVYLLRNYRKYLVFPSKHNEGSYGGAGFRSKEFIEAQRFDMRAFLEQFIGTQMFDNFITKRLYGSGEADVAFFDEAVDRFLKNSSIFADVDLSGRIRDQIQTERYLTNANINGNKRKPPARPSSSVLKKMSETPLLQSAVVHRSLKTIVPPEPTAEGLPEAAVKTDGDLYVYTTFPSKFNEELFGEPRPLPAAVIAEFDRQRKDAAQFRRKQPKDLKKHIQRAHATTDPSEPPSPEVATFTVFFMAFTGMVGKDLMELDHDPDAEERLILSSYVPSAIPLSDSDEEDVKTAGEEEMDGESLDDEEKERVKDMKTNRPDVGGLFGEDDHVESTELSERTKGENEPTEIKDKAEPEKADEGTVSISEPSGATTDSSQETKDEKKEEMPRMRFRDKLSDLEIEEAKASGRAQLGLAFEVLTMMKKRALRADPEAYQSLIDACGRIGDTKRATDLLTKMHEDGIVADGTVYACLVSAFSAETAWKGGAVEEDLPEWANSTAVEMDWNKLQKRSFFDRLVGNVLDLEDEEDDEDVNLGTYQKLRKRYLKSRNQEPMKSSRKKPEEGRMEFFITETVERQIGLGENLLEIVFPDISVDTEDEVCPRCNFDLSDDDVVVGWKADSNDYTTACPNCTQRFVPRFCVQSSAANFLGSKGAGSPLICERLSPWVLQKEIRSVMSDEGGINNLLDPEWREKEYKNAVLWWNLVLSCMRYRLPFTFLLQGSFEQNLIPPLPEDDH